jgi:hypothetical protein
MRKLILISAFVTASMLASVSVRAQSPGANDAVETAGPDGAAAKPQAASKQASRPNKSRTVRRERRRTGSPPSTASIGDPQFLHRGGDVPVGICLT